MYMWYLYNKPYFDILIPFGVISGLFIPVWFFGSILLIEKAYADKKIKYAITAGCVVAVALVSLLYTMNNFNPSF